MTKLTDASIRALASPEKGVCVHSDDSMRGFGVRCSQGGAKTFVVTIGADRRRLTIGRYPVLGLAEARTVAKRLLAEHTLGKHRAPRVTYAEALETFLSDRAQHNRARTLKDTTRILHKHFAPLKLKHLEDITTHHLTRITDQLAKTTPGTARHVFAEARAFFRWCVKRRYIQHSPLEGLDPPSPARSRERVLSDDELRAVWKASDAIDGHSGIIVKLLILTGQRRGEISSLKAEWICGLRDASDREQSNHVSDEGSTSARVPQPTICIPNTHTKNKRTHTFPIGVLSVRLLTQRISECGGFVFPARQNTNSSASSFNGWSKAKAQLDKKVSELTYVNQTPRGVNKIPCTLHDLRRTYATNLQRLGIKLEVIEALLNHVSGTRAGIVGVYQRHAYETEMREAVNQFERWFIAEIIRQP